LISPAHADEPSATNPGNFTPSGSQSVSLFTGAFTYSYPIVIPPGRKGIQPRLNLTYDSQAGDGWLGVGWSLDTGSIHRKTSSGIPTYNVSQDTFVVSLNGQSFDLAPIGGSEYVAQTTSNFMVFKFISSSEWDAWDKNGKEFKFFGLTYNGSAYYDWDLENVVDPSGNQMQLSSYHEYISTSSLNISSGSISYTNISPGVYQYQITYQLETRPDILTSWRPGVEQQISRRLKEITITSGGTPVRMYQLNYAINESSQSLLASIQMYGYDVSLSSWVAYPSSTTFQYSVAVATWQANSAWSPPVDFSSQYLNTYSLYRGAQLIDVNGDGAADIVRKMGSDDDAYINTLSGYISSSTWDLPVELAVRVSTDSNTNDDIAVDQGVRFVDLNGDGLVDIVQYQTGSSSYTFDNAWINTGSGWTTASQWEVPTPITQRYSATHETDLGVRFVDLNGDGLPDIIQSVDNVGTTTNNVWLNTGNGWVSSSQWTAPTPISFIFSGPGPFPFSVDPGIRFVDLNRDGLPDMIQGEVGISYSGLPPGSAYRAWINTGSSWTLVSQWAPPIEFSDFNSGQPLDPGSRLVDINGDGLVDIVDPGPSGKVWLNTGNGWLENDTWAPTVSMTNWSQTGLNYLWLNRILGDAPFLSGMNLSLPNYGMNSVDNGVAFGDVNGDGLIDIVQSKGGTVGTNVYQALVSTSPFPNKLISIKNDLGGATNVQYSSYTQSDNLPFTPQTVVNSVTTNDGLGNQIETSYSYQQGLMVNSGASREFLGFRLVTTTDGLGNYTVTQFLQNDNAISGVNLYQGKIAEQDNYNSSATLLSKTVNTYNYASSYSGAYFPFLAQVDSYIGSKQSEIQYQYDAYGNLSQEYDLGDVSISGDERTMITDYSTTSVTGYLVGYPIHKKVLDASSTTVSETWITYDNNTAYTQDLSSGLPTQVEDYLSGSTNTVVISSYDTYGNITDQYDALWNATSGAEGNHLHQSYDPTLNQFLSTSTQAAGSLNLTETFQYDPFNGQVSSHTDVNNQTTQYQYDDFGRLTTVVNSSDTFILPTLSYQYNISTAPPQSIVSNARILSGSSATLDTYTFIDGMGRKRETKVAGSSGTQIVSDMVDYDPRGLTSNAYVPYTVSASTSYVAENTSIPKSTTTYDGLGRVTSVTAPDGSTTTTTYQNWSQTVTDANGHAIDYTNDAYGRTVLVNQHNQRLTYGTTYQYDALGNLTQFTNSLQQGTTITYDTLSRKTGFNNPQTGFWQYQYDANGNLTQQTDAKGQVIQMTYDRISRLATKVYPDSSTLTYQYDSGSFGKGKLSQVADLSGIQTLSYDNLGRITQKARYIFINGTTYYTELGYDDTGRETSVTYSNNDTVQSYFDGVFLSSAQDTQNGTIYAAMTYDPNAVGKISTLVYGSSITASYTYKPDDFYLNTLISTTSASQMLQSYSYTCDNVGNITGITDSVGPMNQTFQYDDLNRLTVSSGPYGYRTYQYDSFGDLTYNSDNTSGSWGFSDLSQISTVQGEPALSNGRLETGLYLDGASVAQLTNSGRLSPTQAISVELWVRPLALGTTGYMMSKLGEFYFPRLNSDGSLDAQLSLTSSGVSVHVPTAANYNIWSHYVMTYDGTAVSVYVNGILQSSQTASGTVLPSTYSLTVGSGFMGYVDEIQVHSRALSAAEVLLRYQAAPDMTPDQPFTVIPPVANMTSGQLSTSYDFGFQAWDHDGDQVNYQVDWGTGAITYPRTGYVSSGTVVIASNTWTQVGQYNIRYQAVTLPAGTTTEILSTWSPTYNVYIATAISTEGVGPFLIGAEGNVSQSSSYVSSNTAGEWIVAQSSSSNYQAYLGFQEPITSTSPFTALTLGPQGAGGTESTPPTKISTTVYNTSCYTTVIARPANQPFTAVPTTAGMIIGQTGALYGFSFEAYDLEGDSVSYRIDWGTGAVTYPQTAYVPSGTVIVSSNTWLTAGQYNIRYAAVSQPAAVSAPLVSSWSPTYNIYIGTAISTQLGGPLLIGAEGGVSQSASYVSSNTAGEWIVSQSSSSNYQVYLGYQQPIIGTSTISTLTLGSQGAGGAAAPPTAPIFTFTVNVSTIAQALAQHGYDQIRDANGNLVEGGNRWTAYDFENRPVCVITSDAYLTQYIYDFEGNRTAQIVMQGTTTVVSSSTYVGQIYEVHGSTTIQYISAGSILVAMKTSSGNLFYYLPDHLGSTSLLVDHLQGSVRNNQYGPFGGFFNTTGTQDSDYKFTGQRVDIRPDLYYFNARYYDPILGQFITPDPALLQGQKQYLLNPLNLNAYTYAYNNPLRNTDPTGLDDDDDTFVGGLFGDLAPPEYDLYNSNTLYSASNYLAGYANFITSLGGTYNTSLSGELFGSNGIVDPGSEEYKNGQFFAGAQSYVTAAAAVPVALGYAAVSGPAALGTGLLSLGTGTAGLMAGGSGLEVKTASSFQEVILENANFAQNTFSQSFSSEGIFAGQTVEDVATALRSGQMGVAEVPVQYIVRDDNALILNTRSAQALEQADIPRAEWNAVNMTGDPAAEARLTAQLQRNGLTNQGTSTVTPGEK